MIVMENVQKSYDGVPVLKQVSCSVRKGEIYGIIGPNGSGKSTLLKMISGTERPDAGSVRVDGREVSDYARRKLARFMAVLEQEALPPVGFTVREILEMGRYPHQDWLGRDRSDAEGLLAGIVERLGLAVLEERAVDQLSGGERQRAALGKAMAQEPTVLLLDEPTTYLDIGYQLQMMDYVRKWNRECGLTVVAVLHDLNLAALYCDRLLVLKDGEVQAIGMPWEVLSEELVERVYGTRPVVMPHPAVGAPQLLLTPEESEPIQTGDTRQEEKETIRR
ncbi:ABC transporter ATP-binding protein [Gorillibacterium sp. sgz5001074]|uniref:ABC transporter ATP-binding protein n=1 Tax=Gorillibacterium sp. sgz5001074 TaxID=3446695 RepID=UPI003F67DFF5